MPWPERDLERLPGHPHEERMRKYTLPYLASLTAFSGLLTLLGPGAAWPAPTPAGTPPSGVVLVARVAAPRAAAPRAASPRATAPRAATPRATTPRAATPRAASPRAAAPRPAPRPVFDHIGRLVVSDEPPPPPPPPPKPTTPSPPPGTTPPTPVHRYGYHGGFSRRSSTLYLRDQPDGKPTVQLRLGLKMNILKPGPKWTKVETSGLIKLSGWVPTVVLGLRVQRNTKLFGAPRGKSVGDMAMGQLVHVVRAQGEYALVRLMGYLPVDVWVKWVDLGTGPTSYGRLQGRYPGGSAMVVSAGPIHAAADGARVGEIQDEGRIYRIKVVGRWSQVAMYDYSRVELMVWVPTARLRWGGFPWYGTGYYTSNCDVGSQGSHVALAEFRAYAAQDDAFPNIQILPGARFYLSPSGDGWMKLTSSGCITLGAFVEDRPGDWAPAHLRPPGLGQR